MSFLFDTKQYVQVKLVSMTCGACQFHFAMDEAWYNKCRQDHSNSWYCPKCGSSRVFTGEDEATKLKRELERKQQALTWEEERSRKLRDRLAEQKRKTIGQKAAKTRALNRIKNGLCPCCNRTFTNLQRHMSTKHPEMKPEDYESTDRC